ncbi:MAG: two-component sensor histidine kinase [Planctomycetes bacterium]|nr:two-component sensor histidine kinase [Planctomycetota bacterium]
MEPQPQTATDYELLARLVGALIHEIKNPLSALTINLQLLREDWEHAELPKEQRSLRKIDVLLAETRRLEEILNDFLRYVTSHRIEPVDCNANRVAEEVLRFVAGDCEQRGIRVRTDLDGTLPTIQADARLLKQALLNLVINAQQAMPRGGELIVRSWAQGPEVLLEVTDTGVGMPPSRLERIFDVFYSTKPGGSGLGLPTTRSIVERHGGRLEVRSEEGKGTRFTIRIPAFAAKEIRP